MGWIANALMLFGSYSVGNHHAWGFLLQLAGNAIWAWIGWKRSEGSKDRSALIGISVLFCFLYCWNFLKWAL